MPNVTITTYRTAAQSKKVMEPKHPEGEWYFTLNDGLPDVGPFISEGFALRCAIKTLFDYDVVCGGVGLITYQNSSYQNSRHIDVDVDINAAIQTLSSELRS